MHNLTLQMGSKFLVYWDTPAKFLRAFFYKMQALFPLISWNNLISFPRSFSWVYNVGQQLLLQFGCFQVMGCNATNEGKSILQLINLKILNEALLSTSFVFMQYGQYHFFPLTSIRQALIWTSRLSTAPICLLHSVMQLGRLIFM